MLLSACMNTCTLDVVCCNLLECPPLAWWSDMWTIAWPCCIIVATSSRLYEHSCIRTSIFRPLCWNTRTATYFSALILTLSLARFHMFSQTPLGSFYIKKSAANTRTLLSSFRSRAHLITRASWPQEQRDRDLRLLQQAYVNQDYDEHLLSPILKHIRFQADFRCSPQSNQG